MTLSRKVKAVIIFVVAVIAGLLLVLGSAPVYYTLFPAAREEDARRSLASSNQLPDNQTLTQEVAAYMQQEGLGSYSSSTNDTINMRVYAEGVVKTRYFNNIAGIIIIAEKDQYWNGSIGGSNNVQRSWNGDGTDYNSVVCEGDSGIYSVNMQRTRNLGPDFDAGPFIVQIWEEGTLLKQANTNTQYGVVSLSGECLH
jgi:hypothetical protein